MTIAPYCYRKKSNGEGQGYPCARMAECQAARVCTWGRNSGETRVDRKDETMGIQNVYAWTAMAGALPEFISINDNDGQLSMTVRCGATASPASGHAWAGATVTLPLSDKVAAEMGLALLRHHIAKQHEAASRPTPSYKEET